MSHIFWFVNQHSFALVGLVALGAVWFVVRKRRNAIRIVAMVAVLAVLTTVMFVLRTGPGDFSSTRTLDRTLAHGRPIAIEFYSNF